MIETQLLIEFIYSIYFFIQQLFSASYDPGTVLDAEGSVVNKTDKNPCLHRSYTLNGDS